MRVSSVRTIAAKAALRPVALGLTLLVVAGGNVAYQASAKSVTITVDGQRQTVSTHADNVGEVLAGAGLTVGSHDLLAPDRGTAVKDGSTVVLRRGRELSLVVDGTQRTVWVTASSVNEALDQLDLRSAGAVLSADRSREIPLKGFSLDVRTRKNVQVLDGGRLLRTATNALLVKDVLHELKVAVRPADKLSVVPTTVLRDGLVIKVIRIDGQRVGEDAEIPFAEERRPDSGMYTGNSKIQRAGQVGVLHRIYAMDYVNGKLSNRTLVSSERTAEPISQVVAYGTASRPQPRQSSRSASADGLNWGALANCESGGNPRAVSSGGSYRGLYQFSMSTWRGVGGSGDPIDASSGEQTYRAQVLYQRSGRGSWPVCGQYL